jgi:hypothetical protein
MDEASDELPFRHAISVMSLWCSHATPLWINTDSEVDGDGLAC